MLNRRDFLRSAGGLVSFPLSPFPACGAPRPKREAGIVIWAAHSLYPERRKEPIDEALVRGWIKHYADHGITAIHWRGSYVGKATYPSKILPVMKRADKPAYVVSGPWEASGEAWTKSVDTFNQIAEGIQGLDTLSVGLDEAKRLGLAFYANVTPFDKYFPGLEENYYEEHPDLWLWSRDQNMRYRGVPCYADPAAAEHLLEEVRELLDRGVDGISFGLESHMGAGPGKGNDEYGFNPPVVRMFRERWVTNIISEEFDRSKLYQLNGEMLTGLFKNIRKIIGPTKKLIAQTWLGGYGLRGNRWGSDPMGTYIVYGGTYRIHLDWHGWMKAGIADDLLVALTADVDSTGDVQNFVKNKITKGNVILMRKPNVPELLPVVRGELEKVRAGALDGYVIHEGAYFEPRHTQWCELLGAPG